MSRLTQNPALTALLLASSTAMADNHGSPLDWVPYQALTLDQQALRAPYCSGQFVEPAWQLTSTPTADAPHTGSIKAQQFSMQQDSAWTAVGDAALSYADLYMGADRIDYDPLLTQGQLSNNLILRMPRLAISGSHGYMDIQQGTGQIAKGFYVLHGTGFSGNAEAITLGSQGYQLIDTDITACDPRDPDWTIRAASIDIKTDQGIAVARHARVNLGPVPILYTPYLSIPIDDKRHSGFLSPAIDLNLSGATPSVNRFSAPYYWNIAPQLDNTLTPLYQQDLQWFFDNQTRYLTPQSQGMLSIGWQPSEARWLADWDHQQVVAWDTQFNVDWQYTSDTDIPIDFYDADAARLLDYQGITLSNTAWRSDWVLTAERWRPIEDSLPANQRPYARQPGLSVSGEQQVNALSHWQWLLDATQFSRNISSDQRLSLNPNNGETAEGTRAAAAIIWSAPWQRDQWQVVPNIRLSMSHYGLSHPGTGRPNNPQWYNPDLWVTLEKGARTTAAPDASSQALTAKIQWLYSPYQDQYDAPLFDTEAIDFDQSQLFATQRFSGMDRSGDMNRLSAQVTHRMQQANAGQALTASLSQMVRLSPERLGLTADNSLNNQTQATPLYGSLVWNPNQRTEWGVAVDWNTEFGFQQRAALAFEYHRGTHQLTAGYEKQWDASSQTYNQLTRSLSLVYNRQQRLDVEATSSLTAGLWQDDLKLSGFAPLGQQWGLVSSIHYDQTAGLLQDSLLGLEYDSCCWNLRLLSQVNWESFNATLPINSLLVEFSLKGLGQNNSRIESLLSEQVTGYDGRIYR